MTSIWYLQETMYGKLTLGITVPVLFSVIHVCALGKRFFLDYVYTMCCHRNKSIFKITYINKTNFHLNALCFYQLSLIV